MKRLLVAPSCINGQGLFADEDIKAGEHIRQIEGEIVSYVVLTKEDSQSFPDWIGIGQNRWIDPAGASRFLNHSCEPNVGVVTISVDIVVIVAMKNIKNGDELTFDYSTTEADPLWEMTCTCGSKRCRQVIRSILALPRTQYEEYLPYVPDYFQEVYQREQA